MCILYLYVVQISIPKIFAASNLKVTEILGMKPFRFSDGQNVHPCFKKSAAWFSHIVSIVTEDIGACG
jgi:hypothetical protein